MKVADISVELVDKMGNDDSVANAARVSFAKDAANYTPEQNQKLLGYLAKHGHWSPYAHAFMTFRIKAPVFVARQMVKHQVGLSWNEESRRYIDEEPEFFFPSSWRGKPVNAKQGSSGDLDGEVEFTAFAKESTEDSLNCYNSMLAYGVAPEQARMVLPLNTMTNWIWSGSLMAFARVCKQRLDPHAQKECQDVAVLMNEIGLQQFPYSWRALVDDH